MKYPQALEQLIEDFKMLPGVGNKTAERLAFYVVTQAPKEKVINFSKDLDNAINKIKKCKCCGLITDEDECSICQDETRDNKIIVVESTKDAYAIEKTRQYNGKYHILNGVISPLNGVAPSDINISSLVERIKVENISEIIIATSATMEGEMTARYLSNILKGENVVTSRIGYGLPAGADIEYADEVTLIRALESRKNIE